MQHVPRPNGRQLVRISHEDQRCPTRQGRNEIRHETNVDHRRLVEDEDVARQRLLLVEGELIRLRVVLQQTVERLGGRARRLRHALRGASGRGAQLHVDLVGARAGGEDLDERADDGRLADARTTRHDGDLGGD